MENLAFVSISMNEIRFDKYRLLERISHGGMAEVFRAKTFGAAGFEREVAIKLLLPTVAMDSDFITMLIDEAKIAGQLSHANIAQIFDLGSAEGRYYIVQEYVRGRDLRSIIRRCRALGQQLNVAQVCHIMLKVCDGLEYAHNKRDMNGQPLNLVHRDVSPQNILVSMEGEIKLIDFGIAKAEGRMTRTMAGLVKGKFAYMSPEQIRGLPVDRRSDVFACGIVFHELLTAKPLFLRKSEFETLKRARSGDIPPPSQLNPMVPPELDAVVLGALTRHSEERYQSAQALRDAIFDFVRNAGSFYSQNELADWMNDAFNADAEAPQSSETTERDRDVVRDTVDDAMEGSSIRQPLPALPGARVDGDPDGWVTTPEVPSNRARAAAVSSTSQDRTDPDADRPSYGASPFSDIARPRPVTSPMGSRMPPPGFPSPPAPTPTARRPSTTPAPLQVPDTDPDGPRFMAMGSDASAVPVQAPRGGTNSARASGSGDAHPSLRSSSHRRVQTAAAGRKQIAFAILILVALATASGLISWLLLRR